MTNLYATLTPRQIEVLELMEKGYDTKRISRALFISTHTTRNHVYAILTATGAHNRLEAVHLWRQISAPSERLLALAEREGIPLTKEQADIIRTAFAR